MKRVTVAFIRGNPFGYQYDVILLDGRRTMSNLIVGTLERANECGRKIAERNGVPFVPNLDIYSEGNDGNERHR